MARLQTKKKVRGNQCFLVDSYYYDARRKIVIYTDYQYSQYEIIVFAYD